ncbi:MAG: hypothetical protein HOE53_00310 [Candidatus Magasanikbacteria bacterium]|nr:hypothetical protein [Candidatus Magasanikbacteria bacterium]
MKRIPRILLFAIAFCLPLGLVTQTQAFYQIQTGFFDFAEVEVGENAGLSEDEVSNILRLADAVYQPTEQDCLFYMCYGERGFADHINGSPFDPTPGGEQAQACEQWAREGYGIVSEQYESSYDVCVDLEYRIAREVTDALPDELEEDVYDVAENCSTAQDEEAYASCQQELRRCAHVLCTDDYRNVNNLEEQQQYCSAVMDVAVGRSENRCGSIRAGYIPESAEYRSGYFELNEIQKADCVALQCGVEQFHVTQDHREVCTAYVSVNGLNPNPTCQQAVDRFAKMEGWFEEDYYYDRDASNLLIARGLHDYLPEDMQEEYFDENAFITREYEQEYRQRRVEQLTYEEKIACVERIISGERLQETYDSDHVAGSELFESYTCDLFARYYGLFEMTDEDHVACLTGIGDGDMLDYLTKNNNRRARLQFYGENQASVTDRSEWQCYYSLQTGAGVNALGNEIEGQQINQEDMGANIARAIAQPDIVITSVDFRDGDAYVVMRNNGAPIDFDPEPFLVGLQWFGPDMNNPGFVSGHYVDQEEPGIWQARVELPRQGYHPDAELMRITADIDGEIAESNEGNNIWEGFPIPNFYADRIIANDDGSIEVRAYDEYNRSEAAPAIGVNWYGVGELREWTRAVNNMPERHQSGYWFAQFRAPDNIGYITRVEAEVNPEAVIQELTNEDNSESYGFAPDFYLAYNSFTEEGHRFIIADDTLDTEYQGNVTVHVRYSAPERILESEEQILRQDREGNWEYVRNNVPEGATYVEMFINLDHDIPETSYSNNFEGRDLGDVDDARVFIEQEAEFEPQQDQEDDAADAYEPRILPDSGLYVVKAGMRKVRSALTFNKVKKTKLKLRFASEKMVEVKKLKEKGKSEVALKHTASAMEEAADAMEIAVKVKDEAEQKEILGAGLRAQARAARVAGVMAKDVAVEDQVAFEKEQKDIIKTVGKVLADVQERHDIAAIVEDATAKDAGDDADLVGQVALLKILEEQAPESTKNQLKKVKEKAARRVAARVDFMSEGERSKFTLKVKERSASVADFKALEEVKQRAKKDETRIAVKVVQQHITNRVVREIKLRVKLEDQSLDLMLEAFEDDDIARDVFNEQVAEVELLSEEETADLQRESRDDDELPDLVPVRVELIGDFLRVTVENRGSIYEFTGENAAEVSVFSHATSGSDELDDGPGFRIESSIAPGTEQTVHVPIADSVRNGSARVIQVEVDYLGAVEESDENNNRAFFELDIEEEPEEAFAQCAEELVCVRHRGNEESYGKREAPEGAEFISCGQCIIPVDEVEEPEPEPEREIEEAPEFVFPQCQERQVCVWIDADKRTMNQEDIPAWAEFHSCGACEAEVAPEPEPEPECRQDADCNDNSLCTNDSCHNGACRNDFQNDCGETEFDCSDRVDNDRNGQTDCDDNQCSADPSCAPEPEPECRVDADCADQDQCTEDSCSGGECRNDFQNDCGETEFDCSDRVDNDRNGQTDCDDNQCSADPSCAPEPEPEPEPVANGVQCDTEYVCTHNAEFNSDESYLRTEAEAQGLDIRSCGFCFM